jgi:hypothetical protein
MLDDINNYMIKNNLFYSEEIKIKLSYHDMIMYFKQLKHFNKYVITSLDEIKELQKVKPIISSNVNSTTYHLVLIYKANSPKVLVLYHNIKSENFYYGLQNVRNIKYNFNNFNLKFGNKLNFYKILVY